MARPRADVSVSDIVRAVDEPLDATMCGGKANCHDDQPCMTHQLWTSLTERMIEYLDSVSLAELVEQQRTSYGEKFMQDSGATRTRPLRRTIAVASA